MKTFKSLLLAAVLVFLSGNVEAGNISIESGRFKLVLSSDGHAAALVEKAIGKTITASDESKKEFIFNADLIRKGIGVPFEDSDRTGTRTIDLKYMRLDGDKLVVSAGSDQLPRFTFSVAGKDDYATFRLLNVEDVVGEERVRSLRFELPFGVEVFPLDHMTKKASGAHVPSPLQELDTSDKAKRVGDSQISWPGIWCRNSHNPLGGFALWNPASDEDDDNTFYKIWANEGLPHPKVEGAWTVERAKEWVVQWQKKFSYYRMMYILPEKPEDLQPLADEAAKWGMTHVYLHKPVWFKDGYWETYSDSSTINTKIFPKGKGDLLAFSKYLKSKGMGLTLRTTSWGIGKNNNNYVGKAASQNFAKWVTGKLVKPIDSKSDEILFRSDEGMVYPPSSTPWYVTINHILIDNEVIDYDSLVDTDKEIWRFLKCKRGSYGTKAVSHKAGTKSSGLKMGRNRVFSIDPDTELLEERAQGYADFMNSMLIDNCNFDGIAAHDVTPYSRYKFIASVYSKVDHPTWSYTASGYPTWGWFEFQLESSKKLLGWNRPRTIPKRQDLMIGLHQEFWPASGPYDYCYAMVPNAAAGWRYLRVQANKGFHDVTLDEIKEIGLKDHYIKNLNLWKEMGPLLSESQKKRIYSAYYNRETLFGKEAAYPSTDELFRIEDVDGSKAVVPFRMMKRKEGDRPWNYAQEHGLIKPAQYIRPGAAAMEVKNPYSPQGPEFIIRVMTDFARDVYERENIASGESSEKEEFNNMLDIFLGDSAVTIEEQPETEALDKVKFRILPKAEVIQDVGRTKFVNEGEGLRISCRNGESKPYTLIGWRRDDLPWYRFNTDITGARGLGMIVTGDGSGAILTVRMGGNGTRDYAVAINFTGRRYIEIPTAEACWTNGSLTWVPAYKRYRSNQVTKISIGFAAVPANSNASVLVEDVRFLPEVDTDLRNPVVHVGNGTLKIDGVIPTGHYLWYKGGDKVGVYDLNWHLKKELDVKLKNYKAVSGYNPVQITHDKGGLNPWLEALFFVHDEPMFIKNIQ